RLCPALESVVLSSMGGVLSGSGGSSSSVRLRSRNGPRSAVRSRGTPRPGVHSPRPISNLRAGSAAFLAGLLGIIVLIWWTHQPIDSKSTPPLNIPSLAVQKGDPIGELPGPDALPSAESAAPVV